MARRKFGREFKIEAVRLVTERSLTVAHAARDLDVGESLLRRWMRELSTAPTTAFPGNVQMRGDLAEIAALKKEVARLKAERDLLKRTSGPIGPTRSGWPISPMSGPRRAGSTSPPSSTFSRAASSAGR